MRYLITTKDVKSPFFTKWFIAKDHFNPNVDMVVFDLQEMKFTTDGKVWYSIEVDNL